MGADARSEGEEMFLSYGPFTDGWYGKDGNEQYALGAANLKDSSNNFVVLVRP